MCGALKKIKVCCFCEQWESGGIESFLYNVLLHMDLSMMEVDLVAAQMEESVFTAPLKARGIQFYELSGRQNRLPENYRLFRRLLAERKYDVVHLHIFHGLSLWYGNLAEQAGVPIRIAHSHNTALRKSRTKPLKLLVHQAAKEAFADKATDLWACSGQAAEFLFPRKILDRRGFRFIPNGIDTNRFRFNAELRETVRDDLGIQDRYVIGHIGRLCYQKNQGFLLDMLYEVLEGRPDGVLLLVGEGPDRSSLEEKARELGIADNVIFYGTSDRVEHLLWAMDVFVFPSRFEGLGIVAVEAQAAGLPVLCSEIIPQEADITGEIVRLPLSVGAKVWAEAVLKIKHLNRIPGATRVAEAGFDILAVAKKIRERWMRQGDDRNFTASF